MPCKPVLRLTTLCALSALMLGVSGCGSGQAILDGCAGWSPIIPTTQDVAVISDGLVTQILAHNQAGAARGCWRRP